MSHDPFPPRSLRRLLSVPPGVDEKEEQSECSDCSENDEQTDNI